jgi:hypothetical protein
VVLDPEERDEFYHFAGDRWLRLLKASAKTVSRTDIAGWEKSSGGLF